MFNRLTGTRDALVADYPGLTRDRLYGFTSGTLRPAIVIDTGGLTEAGDELAALMRRQVSSRSTRPTSSIMLVDGREGVTTEDRFVAGLARRSGKPIVLAVNKTEGRVPDEAVAEFFELGLDTPVRHFGEPRRRRRATCSTRQWPIAAAGEEDADDGAGGRRAHASP